MVKIECTAGYAETPVGGILYVFDRDRHGRYVAEVHKEAHVEVLLSVVHYRLVDADEAVPGALLAAEGAGLAAPATRKPRKAAAAKAADPAIAADADAGNAVATGGAEAAGAGAEQGSDAPRDPLDHDGDGRKGGSLPKPRELGLTDIRGIATGTAKRLAEAGISTIQQIAGLDAARIAELDEQLGLYGRIERDEWVAQARALLAAEGA